MSADVLRRILLNLVTMLLSLSVHEFSHAAVADRLGDDTPRRQGRLTLSPLAHYDLFGTFLIPIVATIAGGFALIGWARPVQFVPANLTRHFSMRTGAALVAAAGPLSNLLLATLAVAGLAILLRTSPEAASGVGTLGAFSQLLQALFYVNVGLFVFNFLPLPPLDGSRLLPASLDSFQEAVAPYSFLILLAILNIRGLQQVFTMPVVWVSDGLQRLFGVAI